MRNFKGHSTYLIKLFEILNTSYLKIKKFEHALVNKR